METLKKQIENWFKNHYQEEKTYNISSKGRKGFTLKLMEDNMKQAPVWFTSYMSGFEKKMENMMDDKISNLRDEMNARFDKIESRLDKIESLPTIQKELNAKKA